MHFHCIVFKNTELQTEVFKNTIKNTLRTLEAQKGVKFKNIEREPKITGSYKKKECNFIFSTFSAIANKR